MLTELLATVGSNLTWHMVNGMRRSLGSLADEMMSSYGRPNGCFQIFFCICI